MIVDGLKENIDDVSANTRELAENLGVPEGTPGADGKMPTAPPPEAPASPNGQETTAPLTEDNAQQLRLAAFAPRIGQEKGAPLTEDNAQQPPLAAFAPRIGQEKRAPLTEDDAQQPPAPRHLWVRRLQQDPTVHLRPLRLPRRLGAVRVARPVRRLDVSDRRHRWQARTRAPALQAVRRCRLHQAEVHRRGLRPPRPAQVVHLPTPRLQRLTRPWRSNSRRTFHWRRSLRLPRRLPRLRRRPNRPHRPPRLERLARRPVVPPVVLRHRSRQSALCPVVEPARSARQCRWGLRRRRHRRHPCPPAQRRPGRLDPLLPRRPAVPQRQVRRRRFLCRRRGPSVRRWLRPPRRERCAARRAGMIG